MVDLVRRGPALVSCPRHSRARIRLELLTVVGRQVARLIEPDLTVLSPREHPVENDDVVVEVGVGTRAEAVKKGDGAETSILDRPGAAAERGGTMGRRWVRRPVSQERPIRRNRPIASRLPTWVVCVTLGGLVWPLACAPSGDAEVEALSDDLMSAVSFPTTCDERVQREFDAGVTYLHSFESTRAIESFQRVAEHDPDCAMAYWGIAAAHAPIAWGEAFVSVEPGLSAIRRADAIGGLSDRERGYVDALALLYEDADSVPFGSRLGRFRAAMRDLHDRYPDDPEAALFYALSLIATVDPADSTFATQREAGAVAEAAFAQRPNHPGAAHYLIHAYDYPPLAERALSAARRYAAIAPAAIHAQHMPSHIFSRLGLWEESIESNRAVLDAATPDHPDIAHALDYLVYAHLQRGDDARAAARFTELQAHAERHAGVYVADEHLSDILVRYPLEQHDFERAAALVVPERFEAQPRFAATILFGQAWGAARLGDARTAGRVTSRLRELVDRLAEQGQDYYAANVRIWLLVANGWMARAQGEPGRAIETLRQAVQLDEATAYVGSLESSADALVHTWEELGDLYLELDRPTEARDAFGRSLGTSPNRFNAVYGAARAARQAGDHGAATAYFELLTTIASPSSMRPALDEARAYLSR